MQDKQVCFICDEQLESHQFNECDLCYAVICDTCIA